MAGPFHFHGSDHRHDLQSQAGLDSSGDQACVNGDQGRNAPLSGHRTHQFKGWPPAARGRPLLPSWIPSLREGIAPSRRLSRFGEVLLGISILITALVIYEASLQISSQMSGRGEVCLSLPKDAHLASVPEVSVNNQLLRQYRQGMLLIQELPAASPSQRLRLNEQLNGIVRELSSVCYLNLYYINQESALLTLATTSSTVVVICLVLVAPAGVQNITRTQRTVLFTAGAVLGVAINFLQLGEQQVNATRANQMYHGEKALLQRMASSLANKRLEAGITSDNGLEPLRNPDDVARLISGIDTQRLAMPEPRLQFDGTMAKDIWTRLLTDDGGPQGDAPSGARALDPRPAGSEWGRRRTVATDEGHQ